MTREALQRLNAALQEKLEGEKAAIRRGITELNNLLYTVMTKKSPYFSIEWDIVRGFSPITKLDYLIDRMDRRLGQLDRETLESQFLVSHFSDVDLDNNKWSWVIDDITKKMRMDEILRVSYIKDCLKCIKVIDDACWSLISDPILVSTGQFTPKYAQRTYADVENQIASELANMPNRQAKVKMINDESLINTLAPSPGLSGQELTDRILQVGASTCTNYCVPRSKVELEVISRQEKLQEPEQKHPRSRSE